MVVTSSFAALCMTSLALGCNKANRLCAFADSDGGPNTCHTTDDCPAALECLPLPATIDAPCDYAFACTLPRHADEASARQLLIRGFGTSAVQFHRISQVESPLAHFGWNPPDGATIAVCGLFGCAPSFKDSDIDNEKSCLVRKQWFKPVPSEVDIRDLRMNLGATRPAVDLRFGCWFFSDSAVVGATTLERLDKNEIPDLSTLAGPCEPTSSGASCVLSTNTSDSFLGVCLDGRCRVACKTTEDCVLPNAWEADGGATPTELCHVSQADGRIATCQNHAGSQ